MSRAHPIPRLPARGVAGAGGAPSPAAAWQRRGRGRTFVAIVCPRLRAAPRGRRSLRDGRRRMSARYCEAASKLSTIGRRLRRGNALPVRSRTFTTVRCRRRHADGDDRIGCTRTPTRRSGRRGVNEKRESKWADDMACFPAEVPSRSRGMTPTSKNLRAVLRKSAGATRNRAADSNSQTDGLKTDFGIERKSRRALHIAASLARIKSHVARKPRRYWLSAHATKFDYAQRAICERIFDARRSRARRVGRDGGGKKNASGC